jgi:Uncharacterised nucleotidyltransferase/Peptidase S24-like
MEQAHGLSLKTRRAAIKLVAGVAPARIAMRGDSMLPALREGMVLEIDSKRSPKIGDVVVFEADGRLVAHRAVALANDAVVCAGDAQPESLDYVPRDDVIGIVECVFDARGRRVDTLAWRVRGQLSARSRHARAIARQVLPNLRPRAYVSLFNVMSAVVRGDDAALLQAIRQEVPWRLAGFARRHRCAAALCAALERLPNDEYACALRVRLRKDRWSALVRHARLSEQLHGVAQTVRSAGIKLLLLKGAQRIACATPEAALYDSQDIDVLVPPESVEPACDALRRAGYRQDPEPLLDYGRHHHAAPLFAKNGVPVEIHRALTNRTANLPNTWSGLQDRARVVSSQYGGVAVLDALGTALHLAVHCLQRPALRELVLLAGQLRRLDSHELARLHEIFSHERRYAVQLNAAVLLAARMAAVPWDYDKRAERFAGWMLMREDLPRPLRARPEYVDAWLSGVPVPHDDGGLHAFVRFLTGCAILTYTAFMRR